MRARAVPHNYWAYNNLGAAIAQGNLDAAEPYFLKSLEIMPMYPGANKNMAILLYKKGRYREAVPFAQKTLMMQPANPEYLVIMGSLWLKLGRVDDAVAQFEKALQLHPAYADAREALQEALAEKDKQRGEGKKLNTGHGKRIGHITPLYHPPSI